MYTPETLREWAKNHTHLFADEEEFVVAHADAWQADVDHGLALWQEIETLRTRETELIEALKWCANHLSQIAKRDYPDATPEGRMFNSERAARAAIKKSEGG